MDIAGCLIVDCIFKWQGAEPRQVLISEMRAIPNASRGVLSGPMMIFYLIEHLIAEYHSSIPLTFCPAFIPLVCWLALISVVYSLASMQHGIALCECGIGTPCENAFPSGPVLGPFSYAYDALPCPLERDCFCVSHPKPVGRVA